MKVRNKSIFLSILLLAVPLLQSFTVAEVSHARTTQTTNCQPYTTSTDLGSVTYSINVRKTGTYRLWSRIYAPSQELSTLLVRIDADCPILFGGAVSNAQQWEWIDHKNKSLNDKADIFYLKVSIHLLSRGILRVSVSIRFILQENLARQ